ncbi:Beta-galactosidase C-terminal domain, partial [Streptomyces sp. E5N91]
VTRRPAGRGSAAYVSTRLGADGLAALLPRLLEPAGVTSELPASVRGRVEATVRRGAGGRFLFLVNRTDEAVTVPGLTGDVLVGDTGDEGAVVLAGRGVAVLRTPTP